MRLTATLLACALLLAVQSARAAEIALYQMPTDKLCTEAANKRWYLDHDKLLVELVGSMVRAGQLPVDTGGDSGRISLSYSRADIADFLYDDSSTSILISPIPTIGSCPTVARPRRRSASTPSLGSEAAISCFRRAASR